MRRRHVIKLANIAALVLVLAATARPGVMTRYDLDNTVAPTVTDPHITASDFVYNGTGAPGFALREAPSDYFAAADGWPTDGILSNSFVVGLRVDPGYQLDVTSVDFDVLGVPGGPATGGMYYTLDLVDFIELGTAPIPEGWSHFPVTQNLPANVTGDIYFLWFGVEAGSSDGVMGLDDIVINGTIVPEPAAIAFVALGVSGLLIRRRR